MSEIKVVGLERLRRKLDIKQYRKSLRPAMVRSVAVVEADLKKYPATRPGQRYIRGSGPTNAAGRVTRYTSETLGKRWTTKVKDVSGGLQGRIGNNASYGPFVQSDNFQAWMHRGRWTTDKEAIEKNSARIGEFFSAEIRRLLDG
jgi:hypothetical protein